MKILYCEVLEGGMDYFVYHFPSEVDIQFNLPGWMTPSCKEDDLKLIEWCKSSQIGEFIEHRLGLAIKII